MKQTPSVFYQIFVRSFCDSNRDGIGDLNGVTSKLAYLQDLGVEGIWLSPIFRSPSYHKYDITNYWEIDPEFGTLDDFKRLLHEAHSRGIIVILDFVLNHSSSQHHWFQEARKGKDNYFRDYYNWKTPAEIKRLGVEHRKETADSQEKNPWHWAKRGETEKYYGMFWNQMPDLNLDHQPLREELYKTCKFWLEIGADGFRMDAARHIYPEYEVEKAYDFWVEFREEMEKVKPNFYLVGEVWTQAKKVAPFYRGLKANFDFDLSYELQNIANSGEDKKGIIKMLLANYKVFAKENPDFIAANMLTNHDMERIGSVVKGDQNKLKMLANLLFTLPGQPFVYYGEELGMLGKKPDENIREAFLWNTRFQDKDRTNWKKPRYNTDSKVTPLLQQSQDENSLYRHYKKLIQFRRSQGALAQVYHPNLAQVKIENPNIIAFKRPHDSGDLWVFHNISKESQEVAVDLSAFETLWGQLQNGFLSPFEMLVLKKR
ncbi:Glycosidase [Spirosomataceae bacterium TFI 002]|nr:Glycosidase [Spirosomataceae bacterium TFI 002]